MILRPGALLARPRKRGQDIVRAGLVAYYDFIQGADAQVLYDRSGAALHGQLGGTAGADTNDPTWGEGRLSFGANDYVETSNTGSQFTPAAALSFDIAMLAGNNTGHKIIWSVNGATAYLQGAFRPSGTQSLGVLFGSPFLQLTFANFFAAAAAELAVIGYTVTSAAKCRVFKNGAYFGEQNHAKAFTVGAGAMRLCRDSGSNYANGSEIYGAVWYSRALSDDEHAQNYATLKAAAATAAGVVLP